MTKLERVFAGVALVAATAGLWTENLHAANGINMNEPTSTESASNDDAKFAGLAKPHPFSVYDMVSMERVGDVRPSPDGRWVVFTRRAWDREANKTTTNLWLVSIDGKTLRQLTAARHVADTGPAWSPDGRTVAFVSNRGGSQQIWTIRVDGGEARQLTKFPVDAGNIQWSPTGSHIAFSAEVYPDADMDETAKRDKAKADNPVKAMTFDRLFIRHWDAWFEGKRSHIFVVPVRKRDATNSASREPTKSDNDSAGAEWDLAGLPIDVMKGVDGDCPVKPFGGVEEFAWSPDGKEIAYTTQIGSDEAWSTNHNIFVVPIAGGAARCITESNKATDTGPVYSPDGKSIAFRAMARPGFEADRFRVTLFDRATGKSRTLTEAWDRSPGSLAWSVDGKTLFAGVEEAAREKIFAIDVATGRVREVVANHHNTGVGVVAATTGPGAGRLVYSQDSLTAPADVWSCRVDGSDAVRLTAINDERVKLAEMSKPDEFYFTGALGEKVHAWILKPIGFDGSAAATESNARGKKYPVAFVIHGGPQGAIMDQFHYRWNPQVFAGAGYAVVAVNFHGSTGFGQAFTDSITGDWGGKPFEDLMKGLDHALTAYPWLDGEKVAALGASYGGWMINWINGHTDRFKCLVNHDGGFDEFSNYFSTEELWFPEWEFRGTPWQNPELYDKFSTGRYVANWKTPTLVIHGAKDYRLVDTEGIATFTALQRRGVPSQLLYFPDENHWVLKPKNSILWHETILAWLERWLRN
jgi:dipeptidyl aminopeptidase/acylaminoacyl peptidase